MMDQAIARFTALVEALAGAGPGGLPLGELARQAGLPPATATRAVKAMARHGWADQDGNRGAYRLGPRAAALAGRTPYRGRLVAAAQDRLRALAAAHPGCGCAVVALRDGRRIGIWSCGGELGADGDWELREHAPVWSVASGRLLVALLPPRSRSRWIAALGLPAGRDWPGVATRGELLSALARIRRERCAVAGSVRQRRWFAAAAVPDGAGGSAAIGAWHDGPELRPGLLDGLRAAAAAIQAQLR